MKKLILLFAAVLINTSVILAGSNDNSIQNVITTQLKVPADLLKQNLEKVNIEFAMKPNGAVSVLSVETQNADLKKLITEKFPQLDFSKIADLPAGGYKIDVYFQSL